jgi:hypothetical protein
MTVDGYLDDWKGISVRLLDEQGTSIALCNHESNLFIMFRFRDPALARAIRTSGLRLWLNEGASKESKTGLLVIDGPSLSDLMALDDRFGSEEISPEQQERMAQMAERFQSQFRFVDKDNMIDAEIAPDGSNGPSYAWQETDGFFVFEFGLPLKESSPRDYGYQLQPGSSLTIGAEWGGRRERRPRDGDGPQMRGDDSGGQGLRQRPGGGGGRGGMRQEGQRRSQPEKQQIWIPSRLAVAP